ncbi:MAG: LppX_LprAFG lipoprotein [Dehalococcoidia bacterium]|nr:LppX_LprAFG lipoprotein [Dehalococcoidia bacterium]
MVHSLTTLPTALVLIALLTLATACATQDTPEPTATPNIDPAALLAETAANVKATRSAMFSVTHETGSIFIRPFSAKITEVTGSWDADKGADFTADAYLVPNPETEPTSGTYIQMQVVITREGYYAADPLSGAWIKQSPTLSPIPVDRLAEIMAEVVAETGNPVLMGQEVVADTNAYKISGTAPASVMNWLPITAQEGQILQVEIWTGVEERMLRRLRATGPVGQFDRPDTVRSITLTDINEPVEIEPPDNFVDLTGG